MSCSNHCCKKNEADILCSLCKGAQYCSEQCRTVDWPLHACPNTVTTYGQPKGFAVPYFYEDCLTQEEINEVPVGDAIFQAYSVKNINSNKKSSVQIVPPLVESFAISKDNEAPIARGRDPGTELASGTYNLGVTIDGQSKTVVGAVPSDMIYATNNLNPKAQAVVKSARRFFNYEETSYVFWPPTHRTVQAQLTCPLSGDLTITLDVGGRTRTLSMGYYLNPSPKGAIANAARKVQQAFRTQLETKFKGSNLSTKNLHVRRYNDAAGVGVVLTFELIPGSIKARLVDIEFIVPQNEVNTVAQEEIKFACDPLSASQICGLVMAIDLSLAVSNLSADKLAKLENVSGAIKEYSQSLLLGKPQVVPTSAINMAIDTLFIGVQPNIDYWNKKMFAPYDNVEKEAYDLIRKMNAARTAEETAKGLAKGKAKLQKSSLLRSLQNLNTALQNLLQRLRQSDLNGCSQDVVKKMTDLADKVARAQTSNVTEIN